MEASSEELLFLEGTQEQAIMLIKEGKIKIDQQFQSGFTPLILASTRGNLDLVRELLRLKANVSLKSKAGNSALMYAAGGGFEEVVKELLQNGASVNDSNKQGDTVLMFACIGGHANLVKKLIEDGADVNTRNKKGLSSLIVSSMNGRLECVQELLKHNADIGVKDSKGRTAIDSAKDEVLYSQQTKSIILDAWKKKEKDALEVQQSLLNEESSKPKANNQKKKKASNQVTKVEEKTIIEEEIKTTQKLEAKVPIPQSVEIEETGDSEWQTVERKKHSKLEGTATQKWNDVVKKQVPQETKAELHKERQPSESLEGNEFNHEYIALQEAFYNLNPLAKDLDLKCRNFLNIELDTLSMEQISALEAMHISSITKLHEAKSLERQRVEEAIALAKDEAIFRLKQSHG